MKQLCKNKHWKLNEEYDIDKILYLLVDRPDSINDITLNGNEFVWKNNKNQWHRDYDLPAIIWFNFEHLVDWCQYGNLYRKNNKPVRINNTGKRNVNNLI